MSSRHKKRPCPSCIRMPVHDTTVDRRWPFAAGEGTVIPADRPLRGWRYSTLSYRPEHGVKVTDLNLDPSAADFRSFRPPRCTQPDQLDHGPVPAAHCTCGYNLVPHLGVLVESMRHHLAQVRAVQPLEGEVVPGVWGCWAILRVAGSGRAYESLDMRDPAGTTRVERMMVTGEVILDPHAHPKVAEILTWAGMHVTTVPDFDTTHPATECPETKRRGRAV